MSRPDESPETLTHGEWKIGPHHVLVWVPREPEPEFPMTLLVACGFCGATVDQPCRTRSGKPHGKSHRQRFAPRLCRCGAKLERSHRFCEECRRERRRETWRKHSKKRAAA